MSANETPSLIHDYLPLIQMVAGGLLTFAGGYFGTVLLDNRRHAREARNLALAFRGELAAIRRLVARRKYLEGLSEAVDHMKKNNQPWIYSIDVRRQYFNVFEKNVDKIGILAPPLPELIATFYTQANSVLEDFESIKDGRFSSSLETLIEAYEELRELAHDTLRIADEIVAEVGRQYP